MKDSFRWVNENPFLILSRIRAFLSLKSIISDFLKSRLYKQPLFLELNCKRDEIQSVCLHDVKGQKFQSFGYFVTSQPWLYRHLGPANVDKCRKWLSGGWEIWIERERDGISYIPLISCRHVWHYKNIFETRQKSCHVSSIKSCFVHVFLHTAQYKRKSCKGKKYLTELWLIDPKKDFQPWKRNEWKHTLTSSIK